MIYLDHHASTTVLPEALSEFVRVTQDGSGNPHVDTHAAGAEKARLVERARALIADVSGFSPQDVIFTSGATEANNLIVSGLYPSLSRVGRATIAHPKTEHKCILEAVNAQVRRGACGLTFEVDKNGVTVVPEDTDWSQVGLLSVMCANNEIGTLNTIASEAIRQARNEGVVLHTDATQLIGRIPAKSVLANFDAVSLSAHKFGGIQGVGVLLANRFVRSRLEPLQVGGGQQGGIRSGTVPVALVHAMATALSVADARAKHEGPRLRALAETFLYQLGGADTEFILRGPSIADRLPGNLSITFPGVDSMALALMLREQIAFSLGAACQTRASTPSHVLRAIGVPDEEIEQTVRIGFGWSSTEQDAVVAARLISGAVASLRNL